jgi:hypothetical protein
VLHIRIAPDGTEYGADDLDPLLWIQHTTSARRKTNAEPVALLNDFVARHAERLVADPVRRAMFQHDLWRVFDWADTKKEQLGSFGLARELQVTLARLMYSVALTHEQIQGLPDNLQQTKS